MNTVREGKGSQQLCFYKLEPDFSEKEFSESVELEKYIFGHNPKYT